MSAGPHMGRHCAVQPGFGAYGAAERQTGRPDSSSCSPSDTPFLGPMSRCAHGRQSMGQSMGQSMRHSMRQSLTGLP